MFALQQQHKQQRSARYSIKRVTGKNYKKLSYTAVGVGDGGGQGALASPKFGKIFFGQKSCKIQAFC